MPIQPIDLQVLFTQMDKAGRAQVAQQDGRTIHQAIQGAQLQQKMEEHVQEVNQAQNMGDGTEKVNDRGQRGSGKNSGKKNNDKDDGNEEKKPAIVLDPSLGKNIDISL